MGKGIILYQSKYGATKKYAEWLNEEIGFECIETKKADIKKVISYDKIIIGGGIYASGIAGLSFLKKNYSKLREKDIAVFCVGLSPYEEPAFRKIVAHNFKNKIQEIPCFYCRGAWNEDVMSFNDRMLCKMLHKVVSKKNQMNMKHGKKHLCVR